jgi:hypothetical protein
MCANAAGERCGDAGEVEIELCVRDSGLGGLDRRLCATLVSEALIDRFRAAEFGLFELARAPELYFRHLLLRLRGL